MGLVQGLLGELEHVGVLGEAWRGRGEADGGQLLPRALHAVALEPLAPGLAHQGGPHQVRAHQGVTDKEEILRVTCSFQRI